MQTAAFSGSRLGQLRNARRLTQHDLASRLRSRGFGTTQTTVSRWESGQQPRAAVLPALAAELGCSIADLYAAPSDDEEEVALSGLTREEASVLDRLSFEQLVGYKASRAAARSRRES